MKGAKKKPTMREEFDALTFEQYVEMMEAITQATTLIRRMTKLIPPDMAFPKTHPSTAP